MNRLKEMYRWLKAKIWFYPSLYSVFAIILSFFIISQDMGTIEIFPFEIPSIFLTTKEMGEPILGIIAGAFITITTFTFSTTMVVLTMYTSQYTPRVIKNFLSQKQTLQSFGIFVSGFLYTMIALLFLSNFQEDVEITSATVGIAYVLIGIVYFFRFVNNVASYIQTGNLLDRLKENAYESIRVYKKSLEGKELLTDIAVKKVEKGNPFYAEEDGYFQRVDYRKMIRIAIKYRVELYFQKVTGQFVTKKTKVGSYKEVGQPLTKKQQEELFEEISQKDFIKKERTEAQDFNYTVQKVVEVGMRGLSPGINDPNTAIQCIQILSLMLRELSSLPNGYLIMEKEEDEEVKHITPIMVCAESMDFEILLFNTFQQLVHYGAEDVMVMRAIIKALKVIDENTTQNNHKTIMEFSSFIMRKIEKHEYDAEELKLIKREIKTLSE